MCCSLPGERPALTFTIQLSDCMMPVMRVCSMGAGCDTVQAFHSTLLQQVTGNHPLMQHQNLAASLFLLGPYFLWAHLLTPLSGVVWISTKS